VPNKLGEHWPEVALVRFRSLIPGCAEWLAWERGCPDGLVVGPSGKSKGKRPTANSGKPMALGISFEFMSFDFDYTALVHFPH